MSACRNVPDCFYLLTWECLPYYAGSKLSHPLSTQMSLHPQRDLTRWILTFRRGGGGKPSNKTNKHTHALSGDVSVLPFCIERTVFLKVFMGEKKNLHRSIEKNYIIECKAHIKKIQPSERVIWPDIECLIIHWLWGRLSQTVCVNRFHFWMLGFLLVLFCLWILIPTVRFLITKCQIRSDQIRGSQAEKVKLSTEADLTEMWWTFQLAIRAGLLYVSDPHTLPLVLRRMRVMCATEHVCCDEILPFLDTLCCCCLRNSFCLHIYSRADKDKYYYD